MDIWGHFQIFVISSNVSVVSLSVYVYESRREEIPGPRARSALGIRSGTDVCRLPVTPLGPFPEHTDVWRKPSEEH